MRLKITFEIDTELTKEEATQVFVQLCNDAYGEFADRRCKGNAERYVELRYPPRLCPWLDRDAKIKTTQRRFDAARSIKEGAAQTLSIEEVEDA